MRNPVQSSSQKPVPVPPSQPVWQECETTSLQALVDILRQPYEGKCPRCHGSGKGELKGYCEHCLGRGSLITG